MKGLRVPAGRQKGREDMEGLGVRIKSRARWKGRAEREGGRGQGEGR